MKKFLLGLTLVLSLNASAGVRDCNDTLKYMTQLVYMSLKNWHVCQLAPRGSAYYQDAQANERAIESLFIGALNVCVRACAGLTAIRSCHGTLSGACPPM